MIRDKGYSFPVLVAPLVAKDETIDMFGIAGFPHSIIIDKKGNVIHTGQFNNKQTVFVSNAGRLISKMLEESE